MEETIYNNPQLPIYINDECIKRHDYHNNQAHSHNDIELICVKKGNLMCNTGNDIFSLQKGDICFINQNQLHHLIEKDPDGSNQTVLIIGNNLITQNSVVYENCLREMFEDKTFGHLRFIDGDSSASLIEKLISDLEKTLKDKEKGYELEVVSLVHQILKQIYVGYLNRDKKIKKPSFNDSLQKEMLEYIENNYQNEISLDDIANTVNISRSQCSKLFKQYTDQSPINYLNSYRLEKSRELLRNSDKNISQISYDCGFNEQSYYSRLFLREYGCTPLEYRKGLSS